jgi:hypothetical protein
MSRLARAARLTGILSAVVPVCVTWALTAPAAGASQPFGAHQEPRQASHSDLMTSGSCAAAAACAAVGYHSTSTGAVAAIAETWNGTNWRARTVPTPSGATDTRLFGISCSKANACTAVGSYVRGIGGPDLPLAERWNGISWKIQVIASPAGAKSTGLVAVSCSSATACTAVGGYNDSAGLPKTLAERWNGTSWTIQATPSPSSTFALLSGVSCPSATRCTAVGGYENSAHVTLALAEAWTGTSWAIQATPSPAGATYTFLRSVSCTSVSACTAAGDKGASTASNLTLAERWNGTSWTIQTTPNPSVHNASQLFGVSCSTAVACTATGYHRNNAGTAQTLAEAWNGATWKIQSVPAASASGSELDGVSCSSPTACTAVGWFIKSGSQQTLAERWNGKSWAIQPTPNP